MVLAFRSQAKALLGSLAPMRLAYDVERTQAVGVLEAGRQREVIDAGGHGLLLGVQSGVFIPGDDPAAQLVDHCAPSIPDGGIGVARVVKEIGPHANLRAGRGVLLVGR